MNNIQGGDAVGIGIDPQSAGHHKTRRIIPPAKNLNKWHATCWGEQVVRTRTKSAAGAKIVRIRMISILNNLIIIILFKLFVILIILI